MRQETKNKLFFGLGTIGRDIFFGIKDIAYRSMLPSLSLDQKQREKKGAFARICANIGMYAAVVGIIPITTRLGQVLNNPKQARFLFALAATVLMLLLQLFTLPGVKEHRGVFRKEDKATPAAMFRAIPGNDQLLCITPAMVLFTTGYTTTTAFWIG